MKATLNTSISNVTYTAIQFNICFIKSTVSGCDVFVVRFYFVNILYTLALLTTRPLPNSDSPWSTTGSKIEY